MARKLMAPRKRGTQIDASRIELHPDAWDAI
jgi:hypothetical protein